MQNVICVFQLIDDFTGKILKGKDYEFHIEPSDGKLVRKDEGYFVWLGKACEVLRVTIEHPMYKVHQETINCSQLNKRSPIVTIRLLPNVVYEAKVNNKVVGQIEIPYKEVFLIPKLQKSLLKYGGSEGERRIQIHRLMPMYLERFNFIILDDLESPLEVFEIEEYIMPHTFKINKSLQKQYKTNAEVIRIYRTLSDEMGKYIILLDDFYEVTNYYIAYIKDGKLIKRLESR